MRQIKFRGKRIDNGEWVYGCLVTRNCDGFPRAYIYNSSWDETEIDEYSTTDDSKISLKDCFFSVDPATVGQFTGLTDKEGNEIYDGDRVNCYYGGSLKGEPDVIEFKSAGFWLRHRNISMAAMLEDDGVYGSELEIIGNIHTLKK